MIGWAGLASAAPGLVVHEWGTFTTVAGSDGEAVTFRPLSGPSDLPSFVYTPEELVDGAREAAAGQGAPSKSMPGVLRMETPVLYFYADQPVEVTVGVDFPSGVVTEWYPRVARWNGSAISWGPIRVSPDLAPAFPEEPIPSHYWPARVTDAAPVRVCDPRGDQLERFLFYRGVGQVAPPLRVRLDGRALVVDGGAPAGVVFERDGDRIGVAPLGARVERPVLDDAVSDARLLLRELLLAEGLYPKEVDAMLATWDPDWFGEGLRVLWAVPRADTDRLLPLSLSQTPDELVRVMVGRAEIPTPEQLASVAATLDLRAADAVVLAALVARHGRLAEPLLRRVDHPRAAGLLAAAGQEAGVTAD